jgi:hypothetical protein
MPVNFNLLTREGPTNFLEGLVQGQEQQNALIQKQQEQQNALFQQQQQRQLGNIQLRNALRAEEEALAESEAARSSSSLEDLAKRQRQAGLGKQSLATEAAIAKQRADKAAVAKTQIELLRASAGQIMANPGSAVQILNRFGQMTGMDMSDDIAQIQGKDPEAIINWAAGHALNADKLYDFTRAKTEAAQIRPQPQVGVMPSVGAPAATENALGTPAAGVSNAMVAQPPAPAAKTFATERLATVEREIGQMQDVLSRNPENKLAADKLKLATEIRDKLVAEVSPKPVAVNLNGAEVFIDMNSNSSTYGKEVLRKEKTAAPAGPTDLARLQTERAALIANNPKDPLINEYNKRIGILTTHQPASNTITNVNAYAPASVTAQQKFMEETRDTYGKLKDAPGVLDNIEKAKKLVGGAKGFMGPGGESLQQAASFLNNRLGTKIDTKGVADAAELRSRLFFGIMDNLKKLDSQPTAQQQDTLQAALGSLGTDPTALPRVLDAFGDSVRNRVDRYNQEVTGAETRGVKFPYDPKITLPERAAPAAAAGIPAAAIEALRSGKGKPEQFDEIFGAGAAARVLGGKK